MDIELDFLLFLHKAFSRVLENILIFGAFVIFAALTGLWSPFTSLHQQSHKLIHCPFKKTKILVNFIDIMKAILATPYSYGDVVHKVAAQYS